MTWSPLELCTWFPYLNSNFSFSTTEHFLTLRLVSVLLVSEWLSCLLRCLSWRLHDCWAPLLWVYRAYLCLFCHITSQSLLLFLLLSNLSGKVVEASPFLPHYSWIFTSGQCLAGLCLCYIPACGALSQISSEVFPSTPSGVYSSIPS